MPEIIDKELADKVCAEVATIVTKSCTLIINVDADGNADYEHIDHSIPTNPVTSKPYYHSVFKENDAVWVRRKVAPIKPK